MPGMHQHTGPSLLARLRLYNGFRTIALNTAVGSYSAWADSMTRLAEPQDFVSRLTAFQPVAACDEGVT